MPGSSGFPRASSPPTRSGFTSIPDRARRDPAQRRAVQELRRDPRPGDRGALARRGDAGAYAVVGVCEKQPNTIGTLFNTQVFIGPDGSLLGKHQKLMPTVGERLVHTGGHGDTLGAFETDFGPASGLICGENSNPLAIFALTAEHSRVHVMSWPNHFPTVGAPLRERVRIDSQAFAQMSKAYVISACGTVDEETIGRLEPPRGRRDDPQPRVLRRLADRRARQRRRGRPAGAGGGDPLRGPGPRARRSDEAPARLRRSLQPPRRVSAAGQRLRAADLRGRERRRRARARRTGSRSAAPARRRRRVAPAARRVAAGSLPRSASSRAGARSGSRPDRRGSARSSSARTRTGSRRRSRARSRCPSCPRRASRGTPGACSC